MTASGWTTERRTAQAARARALKPWTKSTGPKTPAGKAKVAGNAIKTGAHTAAMRAEIGEIRAFFRVHCALMAEARMLLAAEKAGQALEQHAGKSSVRVAVAQTPPEKSENLENKVKAAASAPSAGMPPAPEQRGEITKAKKQSEARGDDPAYAKFLRGESLWARCAAQPKPTAPERRSGAGPAIWDRHLAGRMEAERARAPPPNSG